METNNISRREFLKMAACGAVGLFAFLKFGKIPGIVEAHTESSGSEIVRSVVAPSDHNKMWMNTSTGTMNYWDDNDQSWKPTAATWA